MTEIAQLFESALRQNRASLLRKAAMNTVAKMAPETTLSELLQSDAGEAIRELSIRDLREALSEAGIEPAVMPSRRARKRIVAGADKAEATKSDEWGETREERIYKQILDAMSEESLTIGQLAKRVDIDTDELRGYLNWMKRMGKITSSGRARATRYRAVES